MARVRARMHPGRVLREEYMEPMQLSASELAAALDITPNRINAIIDDSQRHTLT
jgi:addiction module HigA family antidote